VAAAVNEMAPAKGFPLVQVLSAHKSSCASVAVPRAIEGVQVDNQRYPVDDICRRTICELHKPFGNIKMKVLIHAFITSIIDHIYYFDLRGQAFTMLIITN
jgi:hypothetical protein